MVDRSSARESFAKYVSEYDPANPRIALKVEHTYRVADLCDRIARSEDLDADLAWLIGLLHDIGRFEQVRQYDTFNDAASVPHAALGVDVLFGTADPRGPQIRSYVDQDEHDEHDELIRTAIATHSAYRLPSNLDTQTRRYCDVLRDADKIDILKVNCICPIEDIYGVTQRDMSESRLSPVVVKAFYEHRTVPRNVRQYPADVLVSHVCFAWELVYTESLHILRDQGYLDQMLNRSFVRTDTCETYARMSAHMRDVLFNTSSTAE